MSVDGLPGRGATALVVAKAPVPGRTKTRLVPPLTAEEAASLGEAMLLDVLDGCRAEADEVGIVYACSAEEPHVRALAGPEARVVLQAGEGLRGALTSGVAAALAARDTVALVSSDVPGLPAGSLARAFAYLADGADVVFGPGLDGGYWLVALREPHTAPFEQIPWSTPAVLSTTLDRCSDAGLAVALLDPWRDVDTFADVVALLAEPDRLPGRRTAALLLELAAAGRLTENTVEPSRPIHGGA